MISTQSSFSGAKLALIYQQHLLVYQRDNKEGILYPGMIDLPGGGREAEESPEDCVLRELDEEFGLKLDKARLSYCQRYTVREDCVAYFFAAAMTSIERDNIVFGDEGEYWALMPIQSFLDHPRAIPHLKQRVSDYLSTVFPTDS